MRISSRRKYNRVDFRLSRRLIARNGHRQYVAHVSPKLSGSLKRCSGAFLLSNFRMFALDNDQLPTLVEAATKVLASKTLSLWQTLPFRQGRAVDDLRWSALCCYLLKGVPCPLGLPGMSSQVS